ncbi:MAG: hypothetical protein BZY75_03690 [SAR202 cluster bacterium Io17-Chloro-G7]|nr:MAG: hypothetical protein BZY75_03690 [SAR202 cluster bacterium Io17-Chloro-G7]
MTMTQQAAIPQPGDRTEDAIEEAPQCMHYWVIQSATGPVSPGICQTCGETREFKNYVEGASWGDSRLSNRTNNEDSKAVSRAVVETSDGEESEEE